MASLAANDIFISYARKDATTYASGLADELTKKGFSCFTDRLGTDAGDELPPGLLKELRSCRMLVVLCTGAAKESRFVGQEISEYSRAKGTTRTVVPVVFDKTVVEAKWYSLIKGIAAEFEDEGELVTGNPSDAVVSRVEKSFNYSRSKERLRKYTIGAGVLLSVLLVLSVAASVFAGIQLKAAKTAGDEATAQILSSNSQANLEVDPELSLLLAEKAVQIKGTVQSELALRRALTESHIRAVLRGHSKDIFDAAFSRDGKLIVTAGADGTARVWDSGTGRTLKELKATTGENGPEGSPAAVRVVEFSHDGKLLVTADAGGTARVWDTLTWESRVELKGYTAHLNSATFSPDDKRILTGSGDRKARVWDADTGSLIKELNGFDDVISDASFSPDGKLIAVSSNTVRVIDAATWERVTELAEDKAFECSASFSPDSSLVVSTCSDTARVWEVGTWKKVADLRGHTGQVFTAKFSPDARFVVTVSEDTTARIWETEKWTSVLVLRGHKGMVFGAGFSPDSQSLVTASKDETARVWDLGVGELRTVFRGHTESLTDAEFSPDGALVVTASDDRTARVWDISTGKPTAELKGHNGRVYEARFSPDGSRIVTRSEDSTARIWEARTASAVAELRGHTGRVKSAAFSPDGRLLVTTDEDETARVWDASTGAPVAELKHDEELESAEFSSDGKFIVTTVISSTWVWDTQTYKNIVRLTMPKRPGALLDGGMKIAKFSPDGSRIVAGNQIGRVGVWDSKGAFLFELKGHTQYITALSFSRDGARILTASADETASVWDAGNGKLLVKLIGPRGNFRDADFSPDGQFIVTANQDNSAWVWDTHSGQVVTRLKGSDGAVVAAKFSSDGRHILAASLDKRAYLYECEVCDSPQRLLQLARSRVTRDLTPAEEESFSR